VIRFDVVTLFPEMFSAVTHSGITSRALDAGLWEPIERALDAVRSSGGGRVVYLTPQGKKLDHRKVMEFSKESSLTLLCGRYEGIDERLLARRVEEEVSVGDFVLSGGELAAMALMDAVVRQLPGALGDESSALEESFADGLLDCPQYTRPEVWPTAAEGERVPEVLLSGHHENIRRWRLKQALGRTWLRRPDLLAVKTLNEEQKKLLAEFQQEHRSRA
jgi:tRNA (guanine37-N1)-methyltransferase